jgi:hypothetical protein
MSKKSTFLIAMGLFFSAITLAQTNLNFENWNGNEPNGWNTTNSLTTSNGGSQTVFRETGNPGQGSSSVRMVTGSCPDCPDFSFLPPPFSFPTPFPNPMGGSIQLGTFMSPGIPYTQRPISVDFKYKSNPQGNDAGGLHIELTKYNPVTGESETIGEGYFEANTTVNTWTNMNIPISYSSSATPDTMNIFATSSIGAIPDFSSLGLPSPSSLGLPTPVSGSEFFLDAIVFNLPSCAGFSITASGTNETSIGANDGTATVTTNGGSAPFTYSWSNLSNTQSISGLIPGCYSVTVTDNNQCQKVATYCVAPGGCNLAVSTSGTNSSSNSIYSGTGTATVLASGGNAPYTYEWSTGASSASISNLAIGTYAVLVTEQSNPFCAVWGFYTVFGPAGNPNGIISSNSTEQFVIYPNPSKGKFTIENKISLKKTFDVEVYSLTGKKVFEVSNINYQTKTELNIPSLQSGMYILKVNNGQSSFTKEIIIE